MCPFPPRVVHFVGRLWGLAHAFSPGSSLAAHRFACLGNSYGTPSLAVSFNCARELARSQGWRAAVPGRILAPLPGQGGLSRYLCERSDGCRSARLCSEPCGVWTSDVDRPAQLVSQGSLPCPGERRPTPTVIVAMVTQCRSPRVCLVSAPVPLSSRAPRSAAV